MGFESRAISAGVTKQIVTIFSKTCDNASLFQVIYLKNRGITIFNVCPPLDPTSHLHMLCQYTI